MVNIKKNFLFLVLLVFLSGCNELKDFKEKKISPLLMREQVRFHKGGENHSGYYSYHLAQASNELRIYPSHSAKPELLVIIKRAKHAVSLLRRVPSTNLGDAIEFHNGFEDNKNDPGKFLSTLSEFDISEELVLEDEETPSSSLILYDNEVNGINRVRKEFNSLISLIRSKGDFLPETSLFLEFVERNLSCISLLKLKWFFSKCWDDEDEGSKSRLDEINDLYTSALEQLNMIEDEEEVEAFIQVIKSSNYWINRIFGSKDMANKRLELFSSSGKIIAEVITTIKERIESIEENPELKNSLSTILHYLNDACRKLSSFQDLHSFNGS